MSQPNPDATTGLFKVAKVVPVAERLAGRTTPQTIQAILAIAQQDHPDAAPARVIAVSQSGYGLTMRAIDMQNTPPPDEDGRPNNREREAVEPSAVPGTPHAASSPQRPQTQLSDLIRAAAEGDRLSWEQLVERFDGLLWAIALAHRLNQVDAADVVQTTWLRLLQALGRIRDPERLSVWLATTARRECLRVIHVSERAAPMEDRSGQGQRLGEKRVVSEGHADGVRAGDPGAIAACYEALHGPLFRFVMGQCGNRALAQHIVMSTFEELLRHGPRIRGGDDALRAWAFRTARNNLIDEQRKTSPQGDAPLSYENAERHM